MDLCPNVAASSDFDNGAEFSAISKWLRIDSGIEIVSNSSLTLANRAKVYHWLVILASAKLARQTLGTLSQSGN